jgi:hypothetical protein
MPSKKEKDLIKGSSLFNFPFNTKWAFKPLFKQLNYKKSNECFLGLTVPILVHWAPM